MISSYESFPSCKEDVAASAYCLKKEKGYGTFFTPECKVVLYCVPRYSTRILRHIVKHSWCGKPRTKTRNFTKILVQIVVQNVNLAAFWTFLCICLFLFSLLFPSNAE